MLVIYIKEQGAVVQRRGERLLITKARKTLLEIPLHDVDSVAVIGNVQITSQALQALMKDGIDVRYFSFSGKYLGGTTSYMSRNIFLRLAQYRLYNDMDRRLGLARRIVANKIQNQRQMFAKHHTRDPDRRKAAFAELERLQEAAGGAGDTNTLMGIEGRAANVYFHMFGELLTCEIRFDGRNRRPPRDPVNVILSLGYTFLTNEVSSALEAESFEMYLGFLHGLRYGRKSLPLDIVEEFRQPVIDRMTLRLFNKHMITEDDFTTEDGEIRLGGDGFGRFCNEFERWMTEPCGAGTDCGFRSVIQAQARKLKKAVQHGGEYEPFCLNGKSSIL